MKPREPQKTVICSGKKIILLVLTNIMSDIVI